MLTVREKLAAIRAKRQAAANVPAVPVPPAPDIITTPQKPARTPTKDESTPTAQKTSLETTPLKLTTPTRGRKHRHTPRASRMLWRQAEMKRARKIAVRSVMNSDSYCFMTATIPDEEKSPFKQPDFSNADDSRDGRTSGDEDDADYEHGDDDDDNDEDEDDDALGGQDEEERALMTAQQKDLFENDNENQVLDVGHSKSLPPPDVSLPPPDISLPPPEECSTDAVQSICKDDKKKVNEQEPAKPDSEQSMACNQETEETLPQSTQEEITSDGTKGKNGCKKQERRTEAYKHIDDTRPQERPPPISETMPERNASQETVELTESPKPPAVNESEDLVPMTESEPLNFDLVDQEAQEDEAGDTGNPTENANSFTYDKCDQMDDAYDGGTSDDDDAIVPDEVQNEKDVVAMGQFHRQWEMEKEKADIAAASGAGRQLIEDVDEAVDLTTCAKTQEPQTGTSDEPGNADRPASLGGSVDCSDMKETNKSGKTDAAEKYMQVMFRTDNSRSKIVDDDVCAKNEDQEEAENARKVQQRALWKARQKFKANVEQADDNSLCNFDLFADGEKNNRSHNIRKKLENSCRPALRIETDVPDQLNPDGKNKKRSANESNETVPEWVKQKTCLERRQRKRQRAVSVGNWSFVSHGEREKAPPKSSKNAAAAKASLGASYLIRKNRSAGIQAPRTGSTRNMAGMSSSGRGQSKPPASFKGLLSLLGKQAEMDT